MKYLTYFAPALLAMSLLNSAAVSATECKPTEFIPEDLSFSTSCVEYQGQRLSVTLKNDIRQAKHGWNLSTYSDVTSCSVGEENCVMVDDDLRLVLPNIDNFDINLLGRNDLNPEDNGKKTTVVLQFTPDVNEQGQITQYRWSYLGKHRTVANQTIDSMVDLPQWFRDEMTELEVRAELANHDENR